MEKDSALVRMTGITKRFGETLANNGIDFELRRGEIHALLGENGAGKTTLMNVLSGLYRAESGSIEVEGQKVTLRNPREALALGIGMVHQHFMLIKGHTVAENIILGLPEPRFYLSTDKINKKISALAEKYGLDVDPRALIWQLSIGERQRVEILKLLYRNTRILILDEPTAVLTPGEVERLFSTLRQIRESGGAIIFISHKLEEVMSISDRVSVLRGGRLVACRPTAETSTGDLAAMMVGEAIVPLRRKPESPPGGTEAPILAIEGLSAKNDRGLVAVKDLSLKMSQGEIFGLIGVAGNGQKELVEVVTGLRKPLSGRILIGGSDFTGAGPRRFIEAGVGHIPEDRLGTGIVGGMTISDNLMLKKYRHGHYGRGLSLKISAMERDAMALIKRFEIQPANPEAQAGSLSGGNAQRLILARELSASPRLLIAAYPFRGLDLKAVDFLGRTLREEAGRGLAVLLIGEDLELTLALSDRVGIIYEGRLLKVIPVEEVRIDEIGLLLAGQKGQE